MTPAQLALRSEYLADGFTEADFAHDHLPREYGVTFDGGWWIYDRATNDIDATDAGPFNSRAEAVAAIEMRGGVVG